jgi:hypothetical protein
VKPKTGPGYQATIVSSRRMEGEKKQPAQASSSVNINDDLHVAMVGQGDPLRIVETLWPNDVLHGRGAPIIKYSGNVNFRAIIKDCKCQYSSTRRHIDKDAIALEVIKVIASRKGRFLQRHQRSAHGHANDMM